jgi:hypothetical protein
MVFDLLGAKLPYLLLALLFIFHMTYCHWTLVLDEHYWLCVHTCVSFQSVLSASVEINAGYPTQYGSDWDLCCWRHKLFLCKQGIFITEEKNTLITVSHLYIPCEFLHSLIVLYVSFDYGTIVYAVANFPIPLTIIESARVCCFLLFIVMASISLPKLYCVCRVLCAP